MTEDELSTNRRDSSMASLGLRAPNDSNEILVITCVDQKLGTNLLSQSHSENEENRLRFAAVLDTPILFILQNSTGSQPQLVSCALVVIHKITYLKVLSFVSTCDLSH